MLSGLFIEVSDVFKSSSVSLRYEVPGFLIFKVLLLSILCVGEVK